MKLSKRIKITLFILFFLEYLIHVSSLSTDEHIQKNSASTSGARINNTIFFKPCLSKFMLSHAINIFGGKYLYLSHTLFILYLEGYHTLFGEKLYLIWTFSSGNTAQPSHTKPCRVGLVGSVSASRTVGREFTSRPGHTKDHHENGTNCLPA